MGSLDGSLDTARGIVYLGSDALAIASLAPLQMLGSTDVTQSLSRAIVPLQGSLLPGGSLIPGS